MATSSTIGSVILAFLELLAATTWPPLAGSGEPVAIYDGISGPNSPDNFIQVGGDQSPAAEGEQEWAGVGALVRYETYKVHFIVSCFVGGDSDAGFDLTTMVRGGDAQRTARENAFALLAAVETQVRGSLGVQLAGVSNPPQILWSEIDVLQVRQTTPEDTSAETGRYTELDCELKVKGRITTT